MITLKTKQEIDIIREGGHILSSILVELVAMIRPGVTTQELNAHAEERMIQAGGEPSFKGYKIDKYSPGFNGAVCISLNHEVVHAPPWPSREIKNGDLVKLDIGLRYKGLCTDMAVTVACGEVDAKSQELIAVTKESMVLGVQAVRLGGWISEVGKVVDKYVRRHGFSTVKDLVGHGVGHKVHEDPKIPNYFDPHLEPVKVVAGMVLAIEPMVNMGGDDVTVLADEWTVATSDKSLSAHFEVTLAVTEEGVEILTPLPI